RQGGHADRGRSWPPVADPDRQTPGDDTRRPLDAGTANLDPALEANLTRAANVYASCWSRFTNVPPVQIPAVNASPRRPRRTCQHTVSARPTNRRRVLRGRW